MRNFNQTGHEQLVKVLIVCHGIGHLIFLICVSRKMGDELCWRGGDLVEIFFVNGSVPLNAAACVIYVPKDHINHTVYINGRGQLDGGLS